MPFFLVQTSLKSGDLAQVSQFEVSSSHQLVLINSSSSGVERKLNSLNNILIDLCVLINDQQLSGMLSINSNVHEVEGSIPSVSTPMFLSASPRFCVEDPSSRYRAHALCSFWPRESSWVFRVLSHQYCRLVSMLVALAWSSERASFTSG